MNCTLKLPILKADKRYFSLNHRGENNDAWGIVSDISVSGAQTIVTLRSMVQVSKKKLIIKIFSHNVFCRCITILINPLMYII